MNWKESKNLRVVRGIVAATSLVFLCNTAALPVIWTQEYFVPRGVLARASENPLVEIPLFVLTAFGSVMLVLVSAAVGAVIWLLIMKVLYDKAEMVTLLGLNLGKPGSGKRFIKRLLDAVF